MAEEVEKKSKKHNHGINFDEDTYNKIHALATKEDRTFSYIVKLALRKFLEAVEKKNAANK